MDISTIINQIALNTINRIAPVDPRTSNQVKIQPLPKASDIDWDKVFKNNPNYTPGIPGIPGLPPTPAETKVSQTLGANPTGESNLEGFKITDVGFWERILLYTGIFCVILVGIIALVIPENVQDLTKDIKTIGLA